MAGCSDVGLDEGGASESDEVLETLHKEHDVLIVHVFLYQYYLTLPVYLIEVEVEVSQVCLIPPFCCGFW